MDEPRTLEAPQPPAAVPVRYDNALFFGEAWRAPGPAAIPEDMYYNAPRPAPEVGLATRTALTPMRFAIVLFLVGWAGILFQNGFHRQVVFGAPVFEELAKLGLVLVVVVALRIRSLGMRLVLAWASGAGFGAFEHFFSYGDEDVYLYAGRVVFHAASAGLSMMFYNAFEDTGDVRARWASTGVSTLFHWANNFGAIVFAYGKLALPVLDVVGTVWAALVTIGLVILTGVLLMMRDTYVERSRRVLRAAMPRLGMGAVPDEGVTTLPPHPFRDAPPP